MPVETNLHIRSRLIKSGTLAAWSRPEDTLSILLQHRCPLKRRVRRDLLALCTPPRRVKFPTCRWRAGHPALNPPAAWPRRARRVRPDRSSRRASTGSHIGLVPAQRGRVCVCCAHSLRHRRATTPRPEPTSGWIHVGGREGRVSALPLPTGATSPSIPAAIRRCRPTPPLRQALGPWGALETEDHVVKDHMVRNRLWRVRAIPVAIRSRPRSSCTVISTTQACSPLGAADAIGVPSPVPRAARGRSL
jgi:hypothetical protein